MKNSFNMFGTKFIHKFSSGRLAATSYVEYEPTKDIYACLSYDYTHRIALIKITLITCCILKYNKVRVTSIVDYTSIPDLFESTCDPSRIIFYSSSLEKATEKYDKYKELS